MNAKELAKKLEKAGFKSLSVSEPGFDEDGLVQLSERVHVQVPLDSEYGANVVRETADGCFAFNEPRRAFDDLVTDLWCALRDEAADSASATALEKA